MRLIEKSIVFFIGFCLVSSFLVGSERPSAEPDLRPIKTKEDIPQNIEYRLYRFLSLYRNEGVEPAREYARRHGFLDDVEEGFIRVVVETVPSPQGGSQFTEKTIRSVTEQVIRALSELNAQVEVAHDVRIQARVPVLMLDRVGTIPFVRYIRLPMRPVLNVVSEGVQVTHAPEWWNVAPYHGHSDVRVAVLDIGFKKYRQLKGTELPNNLVTRSFVRNGSITSYTDHGTACAEIIYDMNPSLRKMWLVNFSTDVEHSRAVDYLISQKVHIISNSIGWYNIGAGNGTGPINEDVKRATEAGIVWVVSAGNAAENHWEGRFRDPDYDRWHNFTTNSELLEFYSPYGYSCVHLNWNDWGSWNGVNYSGSNNDFDLYLVYWIPGFGWYLIDRSINPQTGSQWPVEVVCGLYSGWYGVAIYRYSASSSLKLELFVTNATQLEHIVRAGSITIPADSRHAIAVGATDWADDALHFYSSRGPTSDGRTKPDLTAPSGVSSWIYGTFYGTSASAPHVAGALSLLYEKTPFTLQNLRRILEGRAVDLGKQGFDNNYGHGRLNLTPP